MRFYLPETFFNVFNKIVLEDKEEEKINTHIQFLRRIPLFYDI